MNNLYSYKNEYTINTNKEPILQCEIPDIPFDRQVVTRHFKETLVTLSSIASTIPSLGEVNRKENAVRITREKCERELSVRSVLHRMIQGDLHAKTAIIVYMSSASTVSDGSITVDVKFDGVLQSAFEGNVLQVGYKLSVCNGQLLVRDVLSLDAELSICANSTRIARWDTPLGA